MWINLTLYSFADIYDLRNREALPLQSPYTISPEQITNAKKAFALLEELYEQLMETLKHLDICL